MRLLVVGYNLILNLVKYNKLMKTSFRDIEDSFEAVVDFANDNIGFTIVR